LDSSFAKIILWWSPTTFDSPIWTAEHNFGRGSPFHQSLVLSDQVVSEENILSNCVRMDDRRKVMTKAHLILWVRWSKKKWCIIFPIHISETTGPIGTKLCLVLWWLPFKIVSGNPDIKPTWPLLLKTEKVDEILILFLLNYWA
jgi:hypothetical protein